MKTQNIYLTFSSEDRAVSAYSTEAAAKQALARSKQAWEAMRELEKTAKYPERRAYSYSTGESEDFPFPSKDGYWYPTEANAAYADELHDIHNSPEYQSALERWTLEEYIETVPLKN